MTATSLFSLSEVVAAAQAQTQFNDLGDDFCREGLEVLLATYDRHVRDPEGRQRCHDRAVYQVATRLKLEHAFATVDGWREQAIVAPIFVTGLPRSGTSALLNLLEAAPGNRAPLQWEVQFPDPWPGSAPGAQDPRYPYLAEALEASRDAEFAKIHYVDADTPEECVLLHAYAFHGVQLGFEIMLEPYRSWFLAQDLTPLYRFQKKVLQLLNWRNPGRQWLLKAPAHMFGLEAIVEVFADARFVWCHRDPQKVIPSINSLNKAVLGMYLGDYSHIDMAQMGRAVLEWYALSLERGLASRDRLPATRIIDFSQQQFVDDNMGVVEQLYRSFGLPLSATDRRAMQQYVANHPPGKHGKHSYCLSDFGLTESLIGERFAFYSDDGRWPISA